MADQANQLVTKKTWKLPERHEPIRLDAFVRQCLPHLSRRGVEDAIRDRLFSIGEKIGKKGERLAGGDELVFCGPESLLAAKPEPNAGIDVPIVYEDSAILIVNKPAGMPTHGFSGRDKVTLANFLLARHANLAQVGKSRWEPGLVHRLDSETSGLVVVAKTQPAFVALKSQFRRRQIKKIYWALVSGLPPAEGIIEFPLTHDKRDKRRMRIAARPARAQERTWKALTRYRRIGRSREVTLLEIDMETGVTHQIRVHLAAIGHPIIGDTLYGDRKTKNLGLQRQFLHARSLTLPHPSGAELLTVEAELPEDLAELLTRLELRL
jgi:23S rRNA pseudouridine1911/1915/1917 synthase